MTWHHERRNPTRLTGRPGQRRRARILARDPICRACRINPSTVADHIINLERSMKDDRTVTDEEMQGLCKGCSNAKSAREAAAGKPTRLRPAERHPGEVA